MSKYMDGQSTIRGQYTQPQHVNALLHNGSQELHASVVTSSGSNTDNYNYLRNKPSIESVELKGNKTLEELGLCNIPADELASILV